MIWALADSHLSFTVEKPMDVFGPQWHNHAERLAQNWLSSVGRDDIVIMPGDISWGMNLAEARADLQFLHELPGQKYISRGNHDYWWSTLKKLNEFKIEAGLDSLHFFRSDVCELTVEDERVLLFGTRGWSLPKTASFTATDQKILLREEGRLKLALDAMNAAWTPGTKLICAMHYPPLLQGSRDTVFTRLLQAYGIPLCLYGHLHARGLKEAYHGLCGDVFYQNVAADYLSMQPAPVRLLERTI